MYRSKHSRALKYTLSALTLASLISCGGGGGGSSSTTKLAEPTTQLSVNNDVVTSISGRSGASDISLISNDTLNNAAISLDDITVTVQSSDSPLSLAENATLTVAPMTPKGTYSLTYQACLVADTSICAQGSVSVDVVPATLMANADVMTGINGGMTNNSLVDVLANDTIDNVAVPANEVTVSVSAINSEGVITLANNLASLNANTLVGDYSLTYQVCENLNPSNCSTAGLNLTVDKGQFFLGKAAGVKYVSNSAMGFTDENGGFVYQLGDSISFYVGGTQLGQTINTKASISPVELAPGSYIPQTTIEVKEYLNTYLKYQSAPSMHQLGNILTLLYSSDRDKNFANGIDINQDLHTFWSSQQLNLEQNITSFRNNPLFKRAQYDAFNNNLMNSARRVDHLQAMDLLANVYSISPQLFVTSKTQRDNENDGVIDQINESIVNDNGIISDFQEDNDANGVIDYSTNTNYDAFGNVLSSSNYNGNVLTREFVTTYDIHGEQLSIAIDSNGDGNVTYIETNVIDNYGNTTERNVDNNGDGNANQVSYYQFNSQSQRIKTSTDNDNDGIIDQSTTFIYEGNNEVERRYDEDGDNVIDSVTYFTFNSAGDITKSESDFNNDGNINQLTEHQYNANNQITLYQQDYDNDGNWNYVRSYTYNAAGSLILNVIDSDGDGTFNSMYDYSFNAQEQMLNYKYYTNGNTDKAQSGYYYQYDEFGNQIYRATDSNGDEVMDSIYLLEFDEQGNQLSLAYDNNGDGNANTKTLYTYDAFGNQISQENDSNADGNIDSITFKEYSRLSFLGWYLWD